MPTHSLHISKLRLPVHIGVKPKEREQIQLVDIDFTLTFKKPPQGCVSDKIEDTISYATLVKDITAIVQKKPYYLLEHITHEIQKLLTTQVKNQAKIVVKVAKITPPVPNIFGGVTYQIQDS